MTRSTSPACRSASFSAGGCCAASGVFGRTYPGQSVPFLLAVLILPVPYYLTHSSMDYRQPLEPIIVILVTIGLFGTREFRAPARQPTETLEATTV